MVGVIMSNIENKEIENIILNCPFHDSCILPKNPLFCKVQTCQICPEFQKKRQKLKIKNNNHDPNFTNFEINH